MKLDLKSVGKSFKDGWNKNNQAILVLIAGVCAIGAVVEGVKAGPKATDILAKRERDLEDLADELKNDELTKEEFKVEQRKINVETAKGLVKTFAPTCTLLAGSIAADIVGYRVSIAKQAVLYAGYKAAIADKEELLNKAKEVVGEKKLNAIKSGVVKDHIEKTEIDREKIKEPEYELDSDGKPIPKAYKYPCWDEYSGRAFMSNVTSIDIAMQKASRYCYSNDSITVNKIYEYLGDSVVGLCATGAGENHGFISNDLDKDCMIPYHTEAIEVEGYDHAFTALIFDKDPALLGWD